jgi:hypothetical protein
MLVRNYYRTVLVKSYSSHDRTIKCLSSLVTHKMRSTLGRLPSSVRESILKNSRKSVTVKTHRVLMSRPPLIPR